MRILNFFSPRKIKNDNESNFSPPKNFLKLVEKNKSNTTNLSSDDESIAMRLSKLKEDKGFSKNIKDFFFV